MSRKVFVDVTVRLVLDMDDGIAVSDVVSEMDYSFTSQTDGAGILDTNIEEHTVRDSK